MAELVWYGNLFLMKSKMDKKTLLDFMHCCGFKYICDIDCINGQELVASKMNDGEELWWRPLEVEGSGFAALFKGSVRLVCKRD